MKKVIYNGKMHQGLTSLVLLLLFLIAVDPGYAQLNTSDEVIQTIDDIQIHDDSELIQEENTNAPKYDEEFGQKQKIIEEEISEEESHAEEIAQPESEPEEQMQLEEDLQAVDKKDLNENVSEDYEQELEKNANKNKLERRNLTPEETQEFEVDELPVEQAAPEKKPEEEPRQQEKLAEPLEQTPQEEMIKPEVVKEVPVEYAPEPSGPVIVYENEKKISDEEARSLSERTQVEIEEDPYADLVSKERLRDYLKPFRARRPSWTHQIEIGSSMYEPINYLSDINPGDDFESYYEGADVPLSGIAYEFKKNFSWAAISFGGSFSYYSTTQGASDLTLMVPSLRATLYLDTLFDEPYIVPYGTVGYSYISFDEADSDLDLSFSGTTDNIYVGLGILLQLDWLDPVSDAAAYQESGIENTFVFAEARTYLDQGIKRAEGDADFSSSTFVAAGIKIEY